ncbi:hypothetical protein [Schleiferilactobacillus perolens]|uniref:hypothetical protein n=1 Tax=Schleiferilactobacillus perolens TaxID=100468 RepID=UPI00070F5BE8|nr:hypothetical protein [Schleiferilactobacillus perolens]
MTESVQDVFDELWNRYELVCSVLELEIGQGCPRGPRGLSVYDMTIRQRFAKAVSQEKGSKSTPLTEKQKKCPYCHEPFDEIVKNRSWDGASIHLNAQDELVSDASSNGIRNSASVNFCPMCGRRLEEN